MLNGIGEKGTKEEEMVGGAERESWEKRDRAEENGDEGTGKRSRAVGQIFV